MIGSQDVIRQEKFIIPTKYAEQTYFVYLFISLFSAHDFFYSYRLMRRVLETATLIPSGDVFLEI